MELGMVNTQTNEQAGGDGSARECMCKLQAEI